MEHQVRVSLRPVVAFGVTVLLLPVLVGLGAAWKAESDVAALRADHAKLRLENNSYRQATEALSGQISSLQSALTDLGGKAALDPNLAKAVDRLPAVVRSQAMGGGTEVQRSARRALSSMFNPEDTFGPIRALLEILESRVSLMSDAVNQRNALAEATPSMWPAHGWLTSPMGYRADPLTGQADFHAGLDIAGERGQPVFATASGTVVFSGYSGSYGNLVVVNHGFGLETRYGHLLKGGATVGTQVKRGDRIGQVGSSGRATGNHLHYEVLANGKLLNPLRLLTQRPR